MKKILLIVLFCALCLPMMARSISNIERSGSWYRFYDEKGNCYKTRSVSGMGDLVGWSSDIAIFKSGSFYKIYDSECKQIKTLSVSSYGDVISVTGEIFTAKSGSWIYTCDKYGKKLKTRSAH